MIDFISDIESSKLAVEIPGSQFLLAAFLAESTISGFHCLMEPTNMSHTNRI